MTKEEKMLDVQVGSFVCFLLYTVQEMPRLGGKRFAAWYASHKQIADEAIRWGTNVFWGYVGVRVLNPGLYGGVLIYLLVLGVVGIITNIREAKKKHFLNVITLMIDKQKKWWDKIEEQQILAREGRSEDELEIVFTLPNGLFQYFIFLKYNNIQMKYWEVGSFPTARKLEFVLQETKAVKNKLRKAEIVDVIKYLVQVMKDHEKNTARQ